MSPCAVIALCHSTKAVCRTHQSQNLLQEMSSLQKKENLPEHWKKYFALDQITFCLTIAVYFMFPSGLFFVDLFLFTVSLVTYTADMFWETERLQKMVK